MQQEDWGTALQALGVLLVGEEITERDEVGNRIVGNNYLLVANAAAESTEFVMPERLAALDKHVLIDTRAGDSEGRRVKGLLPARRTLLGGPAGDPSRGLRLPTPSRGRRREDRRPAYLALGQWPACRRCSVRSTAARMAGARCACTQAFGLSGPCRRSISASRSATSI